MMAAKGLLNFYRVVAPGYLNKNLLNSEARMLLQNLKMYGDDELAIADINRTQSQYRIPNIHILDKSEYDTSEEMSESSEVDLKELKRQKRLKHELDSILF